MADRRRSASATMRRRGRPLAGLTDTVPRLVDLPAESRGRTRRPAVEVPVAVVLDLLDAACSAGASVPGALGAVGRAVGGDRGIVLTRVAAGLTVGASWDEAWSEVPRALVPVGDALRPAWEVGAAPGGGLRSAGRTLRREEHSRALAAAGSLGVHLVLPLGLCYLPAFVLVGLVPVLISMGSGVLG